jgi:hypothetical protein
MRSSIRSRLIALVRVQEVDVKDSSLTGSDIGSDALSAQDIGPEAIKFSELADGAIPDHMDGWTITPGSSGRWPPRVRPTGS